MVERTKTLREERPDKPMRELMGVMGDEWKAMGEAKKQKYQAAADEERSAYQERLGAYKGPWVCLGGCLISGVLMVSRPPPSRLNVLAHEPRPDSDSFQGGRRARGGGSRSDGGGGGGGRGQRGRQGGRGDGVGRGRVGGAGAQEEEEEAQEGELDGGDGVGDVLTLIALVLTVS